MSLNSKTTSPLCIINGVRSKDIATTQAENYPNAAHVKLRICAFSPI